MSTLLSFILSTVSAILQAVATLNIGITSIFWIHQPKAPKSLLK